MMQESNFCKIYTYDHFWHNAMGAWFLGPSINGLVTDGNTKICCRGFILMLLQSTTANKIYSEKYPRL